LRQLDAAVEFDVPALEVDAATRVDGLPGVMRAKTADGVEVFKAKADSVDGLVASGTARVR
jgi:hypothetical protein